MLESGLIAFTAFFVTVAPLEAAALFAALTVDEGPQERARTAVRGTLVATGVLLLFALVGDALLGALGITLPALRIAGGILLLLMAIDMVFARPSGGISTTPAEAEEAAHKRDISVFPLATPLLAGPGAMGTAILQMAGVRGDLAREAMVLAALLAVMGSALALLLLAGQVRRLLGVTGLAVTMRVAGVVLAALAVQYVIDGLAGTHLFGPAAQG